MDVDEISDMWQDLNERLDALPDDSFDFLKSDVFKYVIYLRGSFNWVAAGNPNILPELPFPESEVMKHYNVEVNTIMYMSELSHMIGHFGRQLGWNVLEMGGGFGNFCRVYHHILNPSGYTILDTPSMLRFSKMFLAFHELNNVKFIEEVDQATDEYDLFVSNICISETPPEYRQSVVDKIFPRCKRCFIIDGDGKNESFNEWLEKSVQDNFDGVKIFPIDTPWNVKVYLGEKS